MGIVFLLEFRLTENVVGLVNFFEVRLVTAFFIGVVLFG